MKKCSRCGEEKAVAEFSVLQRSTDGLHTVCKSCSYKNIKYRIDKYSQWLSLKKRALKKLNITKDEFTLFLETNIESFEAIFNRGLIPFVDRIEDLLPYQKGNLKIVGKIKPIRSVKGENASGSELYFSSLREASKAGFSRKHIVSAIVQGKTYKDYRWEYTN